MCEIPSNVILAGESAEIFDGFSIGSNDLMQMILGVDRDSEIVAPIFDERNAAVKKMMAQFLVEQGIESISLNPDTVLKTTVAILEKEKALS